VGWVGGFGIEGAFGLGNWTWKAEYLHMDLGSIGGGAFSVPATAPCDPCGTPVVNFNTTRFTDDIVRFGVNYRFGGIIFPL
jgi:outer membrane immunogenic protein